MLYYIVWVQSVLTYVRVEDLINMEQTSNHGSEWKKVDN